MTDISVREGWVPTATRDVKEYDGVRWMPTYRARGVRKMPYFGVVMSVDLIAPSEVFPHETAIVKVRTTDYTDIEVACTADSFVFEVWNFNDPLD